MKIKQKAAYVQQMINHQNIKRLLSSTTLPNMQCLIFGIVIPLLIAATLQIIAKTIIICFTYIMAQLLHIIHIFKPQIIYAIWIKT